MLDYIYENKTSALIECAMMIGAVLAGASGEETEKIEQAASRIGIAFQIQDDVLDVINRCAQKVQLYQPQRFPSHTVTLVEVIKKGSDELQSAVNELSNIKRTDLRLRAHCKEIKKLEEEADTVYEEAITYLFSQETNAVELIKLKEIIQELEKTVNKINSAAKVITSILVKYA